MEHDLIRWHMAWGADGPICALEVVEALLHVARQGLPLESPRLSSLDRIVDGAAGRRLEAMPSIRRPIGTDAYMAPEQCLPRRFIEIAPATDVWGLGTTLYESATKRLPVGRGSRDGSGPQRWPQLVVTAPWPERLAPDVAGLIMRCLESRPDDRPTALELFDAFDELATRHRVGRVRFR
jgi:eukaryotic-like serine/threonine-protein kinase